MDTNIITANDAKARTLKAQEDIVMSLILKAINEGFSCTYMTINLLNQGYLEILKLKGYEISYSGSELIKISWN